MLAVAQIHNRTTTTSSVAPLISHFSKTSLHVRMVKKNDAVLIQEMHERLSKESIYYRYLGANKPTTEDIRSLCSICGEEGVAIVGIVEDPGEKVVAVAYYRNDSDDPSIAEPAVLVEDCFQGRGLGKQMLIALYQRAVQNGLEAFDTYVHPSNYRMLQMVKKSGLSYESKYSDGLKKIRVWLRPITQA